MTIVQIDFPPAPKVSDRPEKQDAFEKWYFDFKTCIIREFEKQAELIDQKKNNE